MSIGFGKKVYSKYNELVELYPSATFTAHITDAILLQSSPSDKGFLSLLSSLVNETIEKCKETSSSECVKVDENSSVALIEKTVYNAKCESKKVMLKDNEHGVYEANNTIPTWLENGYMVDFHQVQVRKCDPRFDAPCTNCK